MFSFGFARMLRGLRTGDPLAIGLGALALLVVWIRRPEKRELIMSQELEIGEPFTVEMKTRKG